MEQKTLTNVKKNADKRQKERCVVTTRQTRVENTCDYRTRENLKMEQFMDAGLKIMENSLADSTRKQYEGPWKQYRQFCESLNLEPFGK